MVIVIIGGIIHAFAEKYVNSNEFVNEFFNAVGSRVSDVSRER